jgi:bloom syndrome protein
MVKVSGSPAWGLKTTKKPAKKPHSAVNNPTSTILTSPISPSSKRKQPKNRYFHDFDDEDVSNEYDDFVVPDEEESDEEAFEPVRGSTILRNRQQGRLGPPITTDERMKDLPEEHRICVQQFVDEAKKFEESLRNKNGHTKPYFTERDFREMAIDWTLTLEGMHDIPGIDKEKVNMYGKKFVPLVERYYSGYEEMMNSNPDQDMDQNHQNVIDLCSDEELVGEEEEDEDGEHLSQAEQPSKYFKPPTPPRGADVQAFNGLMAQAQNLPQRSHAKPDPPKNMTRGGSRGKGKYRGAGRRGSGRRSTGSASGPSTGRSRGGQSNSRVTKASSRRSSGGSKRGSTAKKSNLMRTFGNHGGSSGTGGGGIGGIGMMPT